MDALAVGAWPGVGYAAVRVVEPEPTEASGAEAGALASAMARYVAGETAAFRELYRALAPRLFGYLVGLIGDRAAAEDVLQQTFIRLHEARAHYVAGADPAPWIFTIAHRLALDELRRRRRARVRLAVGDERLPEPRAELDGSGEGVAEVPDERIAVTLDLLGQLPENQRIAIMLTKVEGRSLAEAAEITGSTVSAIKLRAHRAYVTLRKLLAKGAR
jgi:RNA polymerase sigma-70 factor (ECF subfamily)